MGFYHLGVSWGFPSRHHGFIKLVIHDLDDLETSVTTFQPLSLPGGGTSAPPSKAGRLVSFNLGVEALRNSTWKLFGLSWELL